MKIAIIGGGPAGAMMAHRLGKAGARCTLFEKNGAWEKPCGGGVPPKVREEFPEIDQYDGPCNPVSLGRFVAPGGRSVLLESRHPMWIVSRKDFGKYLLDMATSHQSVDYKKEAVKKVERNKHGFVVHAKKECRFDFVVGADGCRSKVGKCAGAGLPSSFTTQCAGYFVRCKQEEAISWMLPRPGYIWAFPRKDHICVGGGSADRRLSVLTYTRAIIREKYPDQKIISKWAAPIPFIRDPKFFDKPVCGSDWALIGDAAGHVDALTGEGILYALSGGALLAEAILAGRPTDFEEMWREKYGEHLNKSSQLSAKFYRPEMMEKVFYWASRSPTLRQFLMDIMSDQPDYLQAGKTFSKISYKIVLEAFWGKN